MGSSRRARRQWTWRGLWSTARNSFIGINNETAHRSVNMNMQPSSHCDPFKAWTDKQVNHMSGTAISRREAVQRTLLGAAGLVLGHHLPLRTLAATPAPT